MLRQNPTATKRQRRLDWWAEGSNCPGEWRGKELGPSLDRVLETDNTSNSHRRWDDGKARTQTTTLLCRRESLTLPYPGDFIQRRLQYVKAAQHRESAIVVRQEQQEEIDLAAQHLPQAHLYQRKEMELQQHHLQQSRRQSQHQWQSNYRSRDTSSHTQAGAFANNPLVVQTNETILEEMVEF